MKLYRAADDSFLNIGSTSFARYIDDARAYLDNPGFGGESLHALTVDIDNATVLDIRDRAGMERLGDILGLDEYEITMQAGGDAHEIVDRVYSAVEALVAAGIRWLVCEDSYPERCETWKFLSVDTTDEASQSVEDGMVEL